MKNEKYEMRYGKSPVRGCKIVIAACGSQAGVPVLLCVNPFAKREWLAVIYPRKVKKVKPKT
jgi:hypothetical protein